MALSKYKELQIANAMYAFVSGLFVDFSNPNNRGKNFSWEDFPDLVADYSYGTVLANIPMTKKNKTEVIETAKRMAKEIATNLVNRKNNP